jgi:hypothetical protein
MRAFAVIVALMGVAWLWARPALARSNGSDSGVVCVDKKHEHKHQHKDGGSTMDEEKEEELRGY